tara:strand:+ start:2450 stop:2911 length:462 start_codon:yes stop_codon:yes gene_type:complete
MTLENQARRFSFWLGYLTLIAVSNLIWEVAQLPLYTVWNTGGVGEMTFNILHCTAGDIIIAASSLGAAVILFGRRPWSRATQIRIAIASGFFGVAYTIFSEWHNVYVVKSWGYAASMPMVPFLDIGLSPLAQWIFLPQICFWTILYRSGHARR